MTSEVLSAAGRNLPAAAWIHETLPGPVAQWLDGQVGYQLMLVERASENLEELAEQGKPTNSRAEQTAYEMLHEDYTHDLARAQADLALLIEAPQESDWPAEHLKACMVELLNQRAAPRESGRFEILTAPRILARVAPILEHTNHGVVYLPWQNRRIQVGFDTEIELDMLALIEYDPETYGWRTAYLWHEAPPGASLRVREIYNHLRHQGMSMEDALTCSTDI